MIWCLLPSRCYTISIISTLSYHFLEIIYILLFHMDYRVFTSCRIAVLSILEYFNTAIDFYKQTHHFSLLWLYDLCIVRITFGIWTLQINKLFDSDFMIKKIERNNTGLLTVITVDSTCPILILLWHWMGLHPPIQESKIILRLNDRLLTNRTDIICLRLISGPQLYLQVFIQTRFVNSMATT